MKKRLCAILCALALAAAYLPAAPARGAVSGSDAQAYLDILDRTQPTNSYLIDFDGDGRDELVTVREIYRTFDQTPYLDKANCDVYQGANNIVSLSIGYAGSPNYAVYSKGGKYYILCGEGLSLGAQGKYCTVENGRWVEVVSYKIEDNDDSDGNAWTSHYYVNGQMVSEEAYTAEFKDYQRQYSLLPWDNSRSSNVRPQLEAIVEAERLKNATPEEILAQIPYYGDRSRCRLTAEQAEEIAVLLESGSYVSNYDYISEYFSHYAAFLCDPDGSGIPVLSVLTVVSDDTGEYALNLILYMWENGKLQESATLVSGGTHAIRGFGLNRFGGYSWDDHWNDMLYNEYDTSIYTARNGSLHTVEYGAHVENLHDALYGVADPVISFGTDGKERIANSFQSFEETVHEMEYEDGAVVDYILGGGGGTWWPLACEAVNCATMATLLRAYAEADHAPSYPLFPDILGTGWESEPLAAARAALSGEVAACYSLTDGMCYVVIKTASGYQGVLLQAGRQKGQVVWAAIRVDEQCAAQEALMGEASRFLSTSNVSLDYDRLFQADTAQELADYLREVLSDMTGKGPNDLAKGELAAFVDSAVSSLATQTVSGKKNRLSVDAEALSALGGQGQEALDALLSALKESGVTLNRTVTPLLRLVWPDADWDEPCQVDLTAQAAGALAGADVRVILGAAGTYIQLTAADAQALAQALGGLSVQLSQEGEGVYAIRFLDGKGNVVERLERPVTVSLPASGELSTIMIRYAGGSDNWGGQYDPATEAISFEARYSGEYEVLDNSVELLDVEGLSDESRAAISFMVSKGYLDAPDGLFRPGDELTRYEFTQALVGMFFALDRDLSTDFPDVPAGSPYYPYVASAQARGIVNGYADGTFSGNDPINREQVFALAARTLIDQKGYAQPAEIEEYLLTFQDRGDISDWAAPLVAMAVRDGVAGRGEALYPQANVTREQAAVILYRLFQLLYEADPVALDVPGGGAGLGGMEIAVIALCLCAVALLAAILLVVRHDRKKRRAAGAGSAPQEPARRE